MKKILMLYHVDGYNFGDVLIYETANRIFTEKGFEVFFTAVGRPCNQLLQEANQYDFLLFPGGGLIERDIVNIIRHFKDDYHMLKVPYGVMGLSVGEFEHEDYYDTLAEFVEHAEFFYTRDQFTADYFNRISGSHLARFSADTVFSFPEYRRFMNTEKNHLGINVRRLPYLDLTGDFDWDKINKLIHNCGINVLIPDSHHEHINNKLNTLKLTEEFEESYERGMAYEKVQIILREIAKCEIVVATRFHVALTTAMLGSIPIPITYCPKCVRLAEQLDIMELAVTVDEIDRIPEKIKYAKDNKKYLLDKINHNVSKMKLKNEMMFSDVFDRLSKII